VATDQVYTTGVSDDHARPLVRRSGLLGTSSRWLLRVDTDDPDLRRRGQILAFLCLPFFLIGVGFFVVDLIGWLIPPSENAAYNMVTDLSFAALTALAWGLNRRGRVRLAAVLQLLAVSAGLVIFFLHTSPHRIEILFVCPVLVSAFVLYPWASFLFAGVSGASFALLNALHGGEPRLSLQVTLSLLGIAVIASLVAVMLEWALRALRRTSEALAADVAAREEAEEARRQVEDALRLARQQTETLFDKSSLGVFLFDRERIVTECNPRLAAQLRSPVSKVVGADLAAPSEGRWTPAMQRALDGVVGSYEGPWTAPNGEALWVSFTASPLRGPEDEVVGGIGVVTDLTDRKQAEELVEQLAYRDGLTGLPNRTLFGDRLGQAIAAAQRREPGVIVGVLDLDRFKTVNDTLGHARGDELLVGVGQRIAGLMRDSDSVARSAADEFLLLFTDVSAPRDVAAMAARILGAINQPWRLGDSRVFVTASIGLAMYPVDGVDPSGLLENAHTAMRRAKDEGGGGLRFYDAALSSMAEERLRLEAELHAVIEEQRLTVHYQPQFDLRRDRIVGVEALARWEHPRLGNVSPEEFIPLAEETGLIVPLGRQVLRIATRQAAAWQRLCRDGLRLAVNVSARQFLDSSLTDDIEAALDESGLDAALLDIEVTETATLQHAREADRILARLRSVGVAVTLDDFGTGYSSLSQIRELPISRLKIDRSFVSEIERNDSSAAIVRAVVDLAHAIGLGVVAEGVETSEQLECLRRFHCREAQGFLLARPMPADQCELLLRERGARELCAAPRREDWPLVP
jgi:diguanylate cyclase (GGDEF)-like protein/PAS domain S-box-containing protein